MKRTMDKVKLRIAIAILVQIVVLILLKIFFDRGVFAATIIVVFEAAVIYYVFFVYQNLVEQQSFGVSEMLGNEAKEAYLFGETGMVSYDDNYVVTWMSDLFEERGINRIGKKILVWLPEVDDLISGKADLVNVELDERIYEVKRKEDAPILFFRDVTKLRNKEIAYEEEKVVIGVINLDNYEESTQYEDETEVASINSSIRTPVVDYAKDHGMLLKRMSNSRYLMVLNEKIFSDLVADNFSILGKVRKAAQELDVSITLSMAFARGSNKYEELDEMVIRLMDLAQSRGGDQVAVQRVGEEVKYFGGSTEAQEKRSRVRVRIIAHALRDLIQKSSNVIICCHKEADFDCVGAAIGMSKLVETQHKQVSIIAKTGGIEEKLNDVLVNYKGELKDEVTFISENEALNQLRPETLVIMVDHHNIKQSNGSQVLEKAKKVAIIDHHRRSADLVVNPILIYIEAGASSTCELITELIPYISNRADFSELDATIMLTGMTIDTNHFKTRTGSRTYEAASVLRKMGADPIKADSFLKDTYNEFELKASLMSQAERYDNGVIITAIEDRIISRSMMSQVADSMLQIQGVNAVFVVGYDADEEAAISARSNGTVNVQIIMEKMSGGGHMTAAAVQRKKTSVQDLKKELLDTINIYFKEAE